MAKTCVREAIERWIDLHCIKEATNLILWDLMEYGKTTIARHIAHQAIIKGHTVLFTTAAGMLNELAALDSDSALRRRIHTYANGTAVIDEVGIILILIRHADFVIRNYYAAL